MRSVVLALLGGFFLASPLPGQPRPPAVDSNAVVRSRWHIGVAADIGQPVGAFREHVNNAVGVQAHLLLRLDRQGMASIRLQGGWLNYGRESQRSCVGSTVGCRVEVNLNTLNGIFSLGVGPQFSRPVGPIRTYGYALVGVSRFATLSGLGGGIMPDVVAADENFGDAGFAWSGGVGMQVPVRKRTSVDVSVAYQGNGRRDYLLEGGVTDNPDGSLDFDVKRSHADLFAIRIGVTTAFTWKRRKCTC